MDPRPAPPAHPTVRTEDLVDTHGPRIYAMCARLDPDPDEGYQEIWERVLGALARFDPSGPASIGAWIATIARHHLVDRHRRRGVRGEVVPIDRLPAIEPAADERIAVRQRNARVEAALKRLPEAHRRVLVLHHVHGVPLETLASEENVAVGTIKSRLHRGRTRLAELLGGDR
jgi:RNA polymerase sigma-70 factor (ECF subfamily)